MVCSSLSGTMYANGGIPLKYAPDGSVAIVSEPRPTQIFDGKEYVMEYALRPDVSLVKAFKADTRGNLIFRGTSQNANPDCAVAGKIVLVSDDSIMTQLVFCYLSAAIFFMQFCHHELFRW